MMMIFVVPYDGDDHCDTDVWHTYLLLCSSSGNFSSCDTSGGGGVFCLDVAWLFFLSFVRNMVIGSWLRCFFIVVKRVLYVDMDESIAFEKCCELTMQGSHYLAFSCSSFAVRMSSANRSRVRPSSSSSCDGPSWSSVSSSSDFVSSAKSSSVRA